MKAYFDSRYEDGCAHLSVQTNPDNVLQRAHEVIKHWKPKKAKSYTMSLMHTDYYGHASDSVTGYARMIVQYFTTIKEGEHVLD